MPQLLCQCVIRQLLRAAMSYPNRQVLIDYVNSQIDVPHSALLLIRMPELREKFNQALVALHEELVPNHIGGRDLYINLWDLFKEVTLNATNYQSRVNLDSKMAEFCESCKKPLTTFDILYEIKNFEIDESRFRLGNVEIFKLTNDDLQNLGLKTGVSKVIDNTIEKWVERYVAKLCVNVASIDRAYEAGFNMLSTVLDVIKVAARGERLSCSDEIFQWELGESMAIPRAKPKKGTLLSEDWHRGFRPLIVPVGTIIQEAFANQSIWRCVIDGNLPEDINTRVMKAVTWISRAVTSSSLDFKLVNLSTALEVLLLPNHKSGIKGEPISLRQFLIGRGRGVSYAPEGILNLYIKRCEIIHSGTLKITSYSDYQDLLACCVLVITNIVTLSKQNPAITKLENLIGVIENTDNLRNFVRDCDLGIHNGQGIQDIEHYAVERIAELQRSTNA